jgi:hypothetical protein
MNDRVASKSLSVLFWAAAVAGLLFFIVFVFVFVSSGLNEGFSREFCFSNDCYLEFFEIYKAAFLLGEVMTKLVLGGATIGGILIALFSYVNTQKVNALSNHLSHLAVFQEYMSSEIEKRPLVSGSSVDVLRWYNYIFSESRYGVTDVSDEYQKFIKSLNREIKASNLQASHAEGGSFRYVPHQTRVIEVLSQVGICIDRAPRNHFFETEQEVFSLIRSINKEFCFGRDLPDVFSSQYL